MEINLKLVGQENDNQFWIISDGFFAITDRMKHWPDMCEEYQIIKKIKENKEGFFDFSKAFIDIGAEDGNYAMLLDFDKNYCFEPNKRMCCLIYTNMHLRDKVKNTEVYNMGLGDKENDTMIFNGFAENGSNLYQESMFRAENGEEVIPKTTLDSFGFKNVGLIKTDTEGFDYFVLKGGIETIKNNNYPPILFENWNVGFYGWSQENHDRLDNFIESLGYTIFKQWGDNSTHLAVKLDKDEK
jgi:FkbM family methyltransferase